MKKKQERKKIVIELSADEMRAAFRRFFDEYPEIAEELKRKNAAKKLEPPSES